MLKKIALTCSAVSVLVLGIVYSQAAKGEVVLDGSGMKAVPLEGITGSLESPRGMPKSAQPDTIYYDDNIAWAPYLNPGLWSGVRFTPVLDFELRSIYFAVHNPFNQSLGCTLYVVGDSSGFPSSTVISGPHYVPGPLPNLTWIQVDLPEPIGFLTEQDFHIIYGPQPGGMNYPSDPTEGWWDIMDSSTTTYRSHASFDRDSGWVTDSIGDFFIRAGGEITSDTTRYVPGYLLVRFKAGTSEEVVDSINALLGTQTLYYDSLFDYRLLEITSGEETKRVISNYLQLTEVEFAAAGLKLQLDQFSERTPTDPSFPNQWNLHNLGQLGAAAPVIDADIDAPQMWRMRTNCSNIVIGILDSGADLGHPDLAGNLWTNGGEIPGDGHDNDGNMHRDDIHGVDFDMFIATGGLVPNPPTDDNGHGTAVAGIVGAIGNNGTDIAGICWSARMMILKARSLPALFQAINYADNMKTAHGVDVRIINQSSGVFIGGTGPNALLFGIAAATLAANNILWIVSAGNNGWNLDALPPGIPPGAVRYPAMLPNANVICVAASDENDNVAGSLTPPWASNTGPVSVDLAAPGKNIPTLRRVAAGGATRVFHGTSAAAPHVTGAAALIWSLDPGLTLANVRDILLNGAPHPSLPSAAVEQKPAFVGNIVTEGRLRAPVNGDFGDAPDPPYPTIWPRYFGAGNDGPRHLDCGLEWLGDDISVERDPTDPLDTDGVPNLVDNDGFDDGVTFFPPYFCKGLAPRDQVEVRVTARVPTPPVGATARYGGAAPGGKYLYLSAWFDFNGDGDWIDVFTCPPGVAGNAPEHILWQAAVGPGIMNGPGFHAFPDHVIVINPSAWGAPPGAQAFRDYILEFYSPPKESLADTIWTRFRLEYDDQVAPIDFRGTFDNYTRFGEVEDHFSLADTILKPSFGLRIKERFGFPGQDVDMSVTLCNSDSVGGYDILIHWDCTLAELVDVEQKYYHVDGDSFQFEYFNWSSWQVDDGCKARVIGITNTPNGPNTPPLSPGQDQRLFDLIFHVSSQWDPNYQIPIDFEVDDPCKDNTLSNKLGTQLWTAKERHLWQGTEYNVEEILACGSIEQSIVLYGGKIEGEGIYGPYGDVNHDGIPYSIADAVYFMEYLKGEVELEDEGYQGIASDINQDGHQWTIADLIYLVNIINGSAQRPGEGAKVVTRNVNVIVKNQAISVDAEIGGIYLVVKGGSEPVLNAADMKMETSVVNDERRIIIVGADFPMESNTATGDLITIPGSFEITSVQVSDPAGYLMTAKINFLPTEFALAQNYPNPFNPVTEIKYALPEECYVTIEIYNILGQKVANLVDGEQKAGYKIVRWDASLVTSGIYFYRLQAGDFVETRKMILLR